VGLTVRFTVGFGIGFTVGCTTGLGATGAVVEPGTFFVASMITFPVMGSVCTSIQTLLVHCDAYVGDVITVPEKSEVKRRIENENLLMGYTHAA